MPFMNGTKNLKILKTTCEAATILFISAKRTAAGDIESYTNWATVATLPSGLLETLKAGDSFPKFLRADASERSSESTILTRLASGQPDHPGRTHVTTLLDEFHLTGPNGRHRCFVTTAAGCSTAQSKEYSMSWMFPVDAARAIAVQVLRGLAYIHSCGIVHAGMLVRDNERFKDDALVLLGNASTFTFCLEPDNRDLYDVS